MCQSSLHMQPQSENVRVEMSAFMTPVFRKSFRPTASRTYKTKSPTLRRAQTQVSCASRTPMEEALEADTSPSRGHVYFALTPAPSTRRQDFSRSGNQLQAPTGHDTFPC